MGPEPVLSVGVCWCWFLFKKGVFERGDDLNGRDGMGAH